MQFSTYDGYIEEITLIYNFLYAIFYKTNTSVAMPDYLKERIRNYETIKP